MDEVMVRKSTIHNRRTYDLIACYAMNKIPVRDDKDRVRKRLIYAKASCFDSGMGIV